MRRGFDDRPILRALANSWSTAGAAARLQINPGELVRYLARQDNGFYQLIGSQSGILGVVARPGRYFLKGISAANRLFPEPA